jgi:phenylpropionate dioxygenase-like ring-hydroxylating dioxygenase large terminal subunit
MNISRADLPKREDIRADFVPRDRYVAADMLLREKERLWPRIWHIVCREEEVSGVGDFVTYEIFDESIVVIRTNERIKAYYNVCQHRGRRLMDKPSGNQRFFYCKFHGWKYNLDGSIAHVFRREDWANCGDFGAEKLSLKEPRIELWGGWVWVNMDPDAPCLTDWLGEGVLSRLDPFEFQALRRAWHEVIVAPVNWKVIVEAFSEGYHSGATHNHWIDYTVMQSPTAVFGNHAAFFTVFNGLPRVKREDGAWGASHSLQDMLFYQSKEIHDTLHALVTPPTMRAIERLKAETSAETPPEQLFSRLLELQKEEVEATGAAWPKALTPAAIGAAGTGWHIFPNTVVLPAADGVLWYRMRPHGEDPHQSIFDIWCLSRYAPGKEPKIETHVSQNFEEFRGRNGFLEQDFANMLAVDRGMESRGWEGARTNPAEEITINHFHSMLDRYLCQRIDGEK